MNDLQKIANLLLNLTYRDMDLLSARLADCVNAMREDQLDTDAPYFSTILLEWADERIGEGVDPE
jgi:hypothetical protein